MVIHRIEISARMIERLLDLLANDLSVSLGDVARESGVNYDTLNQIRFGRVKSMRCDTLAAIIKAYPSINANYVLTGEGAKLLTKSKSTFTKEELSNLTDDARAVYEAGGRLLQHLGGD